CATPRWARCRGRWPASPARRSSSTSPARPRPSTRCSASWLRSWRTPSPPSAVTTAIELDGLGRAYGERTALAGVTLSLPAGRTLVVFGPNGAGKSTLLRILATLLRPTTGTARVLGSELPREAWRVRGRIGLLGHDPLLYRELS